MRSTSATAGAFIAAAMLAASSLAADTILIDGRVVETKADGACPRSTPLLPGNQRYLDCGNGTVWDLHTGLLWMQRARCPALGPHDDGTASYLQAASATFQLEHGFDCDDDGVADLTDGSQRGDWRLPTRAEWERTINHARFGLGCYDGGPLGAPSLTDRAGTTCHDRASTALFSQIALLQAYWSSEAVDWAPTSVYTASLLSGDIELQPRSTLLPIWAVRPASSDPEKAVVRVDGAEIETAANPPCYDELGIGIERYVDCGDGTVLDTVTDLLWLQDASCTEIPGVHAASEMANWVLAMEGVPLLENGLCGLTDGSQQGDWRLPTAEEWERTIEQAEILGCEMGGVGGPPSLTDSAGTGCLADDPTPVFTGVLERYWALDLFDILPDEAREVSLERADVNSSAKSTPWGVWPVRSRR